MSREMWAPKKWREVPGIVGFTGRPEPLWSDDVRVLVQEIPEGMPDFKPGDKVRGYSHSGTVRAVAPTPDGWRVFWESDETCRVYEAAPHALTLIPRETSRLIRVTGLEKDVAAFTGECSLPEWPARFGVRVEVVDE